MARPFAGRRLWGVLAMAGLLGACADDRPPGIVGHISGFSGVIAADEPQAVLVARDILSAGGLAGDAAVAMGFTLAVTLPSSAGLGGGGVCLAYDSESNKVETLDFRPGAAGAARAGGMAVPSLARGLFALHARMGSWRWESLVMPAENLARFGFPVSRALRLRLADLPPGLPARGEISPFLEEGKPLALHTLAGTLGRLRQWGAGAMHDGPLAREIVDGAHSLGLGLDPEALRSQMPRWVASQSSRQGNEILHQAVFGDTAPAAAAPGATGFVVADRLGNAVSCVLTMGRPFGLGRVLPDQGFYAAAPDSEGAEPLAALLLVNSHVREFRFAVAAAGSGAPALARGTADALLQKVHPIDAIQGSVGAGSNNARVSVAACSKGIPPNPASCQVGVDPRGAGYALRVGL